MTSSAIVLSGTSPAPHGQSGTCVWHPFLPEPPNPECSTLRAIFFGHRWTAHIKWIGVGVVTAALYAGGPKSVALFAFAAVLTIILSAVSFAQVVRDARRCVRHHAVPIAGHADAREYLQRMREHGIGLILHCMSQGGTSRTQVFEHPPVGPLTPVEVWAPPAARICTGPSLRSLMEYWTAREELCWQAAQLLLFKKWASRGARPCAGQLNRWIDEHGSRNEAFTTFVRELAALAAESDGRIIAYRQEQAAAVRLHSAKQEAEAEARRLQKIRQEQEAREHVARLAHYPRERGAEERAAQSRFVVQLNRLSTQVDALTEVRDGFRSRGEVHQAEHVERELVQLRAELRRFEWLKPN